MKDSSAVKHQGNHEQRVAGWNNECNVSFKCNKNGNEKNHPTKVTKHTHTPTLMKKKKTKAVMGSLVCVHLMLLMIVWNVGLRHSACACLPLFSLYKYSLSFSLKKSTFSVTGTCLSLIILSLLMFFNTFIFGFFMFCCFCRPLRISWKRPQVSSFVWLCLHEMTWISSWDYQMRCKDSWTKMIWWAFRGSWWLQTVEV